MKQLQFALVGNPNCGKTTLFNRLTGSTAHVGNWPGVTVDIKEGTYKAKGKSKPGFAKVDASSASKSSFPDSIKIVDMPGIYSAAPYSPEEKIAHDYLISGKPSAVINIVNATGLERNLYLTTELLETDRPIVIALNMIDEAEKRGITIDCKRLSNLLGVPVVPISAAKGRGIDELLDAAVSVAGSRRKPKSVLENTTMFSSIDSIRDVLSDNGLSNPLFSAVKMVECGCKPFGNEHASLSKSDLQRLDRLCKVADKLCETGSVQSEVAEQRYKFIEQKCVPYIHNSSKRDISAATEKLDSILMRTSIAVPIFAVIMAVVFFLTFGNIGDIPMPGVFLQQAAASLIDWLREALKSGLTALGADNGSAAQGLLINGIFDGVGSVIEFLPQILILFFFISLLEGSGYMARTAYVTDCIFRRFGLSGKSVVPLIMGFGCSVPAIMATRTVENQKLQRLTILLTPFMSCGAKLPVYTMLIGTVAAFSGKAWMIICGVYLLGIISAMITAILMKKTDSKDKDTSFMLEMPEYRVPAARNVLATLWEKSKHFIVKAGTLILISAIVIWVLQNFDLSFNMVKNPEQSILGTIGGFIAPIMKPLGFGTWQAAVAVLTGFIAREMVVSTLGVVYCGSVSASALFGAHQVAGALSFMAFILLLPPCIAAQATMLQEVKSKKYALFNIAYQLVFAWSASLIIYTFARLLGG